VRLLRHDLHTLTGVYALDALDTQAERDRFERHLNRCQSCASEVRGLRETATRLAMAAARTPPPGLRHAVMAAVTRTRQLPAIAHHARPEPRLGWVPRLAGAVAAVATAVAVALGVVLAGTQHQLDRSRAQNQAIAAVLAAPDAHVLTSKTSKGGSASVVVSAAERKMVVTTAGLPPLPSSKVYELWLIGAHKNIRPAGLLPLPVNGHTSPLLASGLLHGDTFGVTVEPAGGSPQPTTRPFVLIPLTG